METPKEDKKIMSESNEIKNEEAPRRKKNIIRVYHAQNASDAGRRKREPGEKRPQRPGQGRPRPGAARPGQRENADRQDPARRLRPKQNRQEYRELRSLQRKHPL